MSKYMQERCFFYFEISLYLIDFFHNLLVLQTISNPHCRQEGADGEGICQACYKRVGEVVQKRDAGRLIEVCENNDKPKTKTKTTK